MSLNESERAQTARELRENFQKSGLTLDQVASELGVSPGQIDQALDLSGHPASTWKLRDFLQAAVLRNGQTPTDYSVLTEAQRDNARAWFGIE